MIENMTAHGQASGSTWGRRGNIHSITLFFIIGIMLGIFAVFVLVPSADGSAPAVRAEGGAVSGLVTDPNGGPAAEGTTVILFTADDTLKGVSQLDENGGFQFQDVALGHYLVVAQPPDDSSFTRSLPLVVSMLGQAIDLGTIPLTNPTLVGTVFGPDGETPTGAFVEVSQGEDEVYNQFAPAGEIKIGGLLPGSYTIKAIPNPADRLWESPAQTVTVTTGISQTIDLTLRTADVTGQVVDVTGAPVPWSTVYVWGEASGTFRLTLAGANGHFGIGNLPEDGYLLKVDPPLYADSLASSEPVAFEIPPVEQDLGQILLPTAPKTVVGQVKTNTGTPVTDAIIVAHRVGFPAGQEVPTNENGRYTLNLTAGVWSVTVRPAEDATDVSWIYPEAPQFLHFDDDERQESRQIDFEVLTADSEVSGRITMPDGTLPPFAVAVSIRNNEGLGQDVLIDAADGSFSTRLPHGRYLFYAHPEDTAFAGPDPEQIVIEPESTLDLGSKGLILRDAVISGSVVDQDGIGVEGVELIAWSDRYQASESVTAPDGTYTLPVVPGDWLVRPAVPATLPYIYTGEPLAVAVESGQLVADVQFSLTNAPNRVDGMLAADEILATTEGWLTAIDAETEEPVNGAPIEGGHFDLYLPDGSYLLRPHLPPESQYIPARPISLTVSAGESVSATVPVLEKDASINGALWDPRYEETVTDLPAVVFAANDSAFAATAINTDNGAYRLGLTAGIWHVGYFVEPQSNYVALNRRRNIPLEAEQNALYPLRVAVKDAVLTGQVTDPAGNGIPNAVVFAAGTSPLLKEVTLHTVTDPFGNYYLPVPYGRYRLWSGMEGQTWLSPVERRTYVRQGEIESGVNLMYREADATLSGTVSLAAGTPLEDEVSIFGYGADGAFAQTTANVGEPYALPVVSGQTWYLVAAVENDSGTFYAVRTRTAISGDTVLDLELDGPFSKPAPIAVTFKSDEEQEIVLADGTEIYIPAGALPVDVGEDVTLHITPIATLPHQHHARLYKYGYAFIALDQNGTQITSNFNQNVYITFSYSDAEIDALDLDEDVLVPAWYSTSTQTWMLPQSYVVDQAHNRVVLGIDHFTDFALINGADTNEVYIPMFFK